MFASFRKAHDENDRDQHETNENCDDGIFHSGTSLEPDFNFVAIRIGDVSVGEARSELATTEQATSGAFDLGDGTVDVSGVHQPKTEMRDAPAETGGGGVLGEGDDVVPARSLSMDESISAPVLTQTKNLLVEPQRASQVADGEIDVRKAVSLNHNNLDLLSRSNEIGRASCREREWVLGAE